jgi:N-hydroxyarylamine O-acetyltransferase
MLLRIDLEERSHVADVGFGGLTLTGPLRLEPDIDQATPHEPFRLNRAGGDFVMQARLREDWKALYRFDTHRHLPCDYEASNYYLSTHPDSRFIHTLIAARPSTDRRYALLNNQLTDYSPALPNCAKHCKSYLS